MYSALRALRSLPCRPRPASWIAISILAATIAGSVMTPAAAQDVPCEKYQLENGMTVILHEDHARPAVAINTWYYVGSKDEPPRRSGFAHLFEHLMFMGTQRVPGGNFDTIMEAGGGSNNASTSTDRTNYYSSGPAHLLPTLLWLDADRLEDLARTMDQDKLDKQRDVVRNERRQTSENVPYGKAELKIPELMYPVDHPYHNTVIGSHEDLQAASVHDVREFFANYYVPRNASLVVAGDFDPAVVKPLIASLFGTIAGGKAPEHRTATPCRLDRVIRFTTLDAVDLPRVSFVYHSPALFAPGDAELDLAAALLADGVSSRLYKRLVFDERVAADVVAYQASALLGSLFQINVTTLPGSDLDAIERAVDEELARLSRDLGAEELQRKKTSMELSSLLRIQGLLERADRMNQYNAAWGEPNSFRRDLERYRSATPESVREWAQKVFTPDARLVLRVLPEKPARAGTPRDQRPTDLGVARFTPAAPEEFALSNGIRVHFWHRPELALVAMDVQIASKGPLVACEEAGLSDLTAQMLSQGAAGLDAIHFEQEVEKLGAEFAAAADYEAVSVSLTALTRTFEPAARLAAEAIFAPGMTDSDWQRIHALHLENLKQEDAEPTIVATRATARFYFGESHPFARPTSGTPVSVRGLDLEQVRAFHARLFQPQHTTIFLAGDVTPEAARATLEKHFGGRKPAAGAAPTTSIATSFAPPDRLRVAIVDRPGAVQTVIRFQMPSARADDARRPELRLLNVILGGSFTSRLNQNLREQHGYTYGARSRVNMGPELGWLVAQSSVRADVTGEALGEFLGELSKLRKGDVTSGDAQKARETLRTETINAFESLGGIVATAADLAANGLPFASLAADMAKIETADAASLNALAHDAIPLDQSVLVLVGDKTLILSELRELRASLEKRDGKETLLLPEPIELDTLGEPLPTR